MPRGQRRTLNTDILDRELAQLKERERELRQRLRALRGTSSTRRLEEKLTRQLAWAKWTIQEIRTLRPDRDERGFYESVPAKAPTARRPRRRRSETGTEG
jgi:hypothetical protein